MGIKQYLLPGWLWHSICDHLQRAPDSPLQVIHAPEMLYKLSALFHLCHFYFSVPVGALAFESCLVLWEWKREELPGELGQDSGWRAVPCSLPAAEGDNLAIG